MGLCLHRTPPRPSDKLLARETTVEGDSVLRCGCWLVDRTPVEGHTTNSIRTAQIEVLRVYEITNKKRSKVGLVGKWSCLRKELGGRIFLIKIHWQKFSKM